MKTNMKINKLISLFGDLYKILQDESEKNWSRTIIQLKNKLESSNSEVDQERVLNEVVRTYKKIYAGNGSFSDYSIWKDDPDERAQANKQLSRVLDEIWELIR